jgi:hypothetical protein
MLLDKQNLFSDLLLSAIPAAASTATDTVDLLGGGTADTQSDITPNVSDVQLLAIITDAACAGGTSLNIQLFTGATAAALTTKVSESGVIVTATMVQGYRFPIAIPAGFPLLRWLTCQLVQAGTAFTGTGRLMVALVPRGGEQTAQA